MLLTLGGVLGVISCGRQSPSPALPVPPPAVERPTDAAFQAQAMTAIHEAFALLSSNLLAALDQGGVTQAIPYCSVEAASLTASAGQAERLALRRVSDRVRNPENAASPAELAVMAQMRQVLAAGRTPAPRPARDAEGPVLYAPIVMTQPLCLMCHGQPGVDVQDETLAVLRERYPNDHATGFAMNDLRGLWVVRPRAQD